MGEELNLSEIVKVLSVGVFSGTAAFMFMPLIKTGVVGYFTPAFVGVLVASPLIQHFLQVPREGFDFQEYYQARKIRGITADFLMVLMSAFAPGIIFLYGLLRLGLLPPVPEAFAAAVGVFTGYSAFLYRNRKFYREERIDIEL
jgi:hypothetical protein